MINAKEAKAKASNLSDADSFYYSIVSKIYCAISSGFFKETWVVPVRNECLKEMLDIIRSVVYGLEVSGFNCNLTTFVENNKFTMVRLGISWE